MPQDQTEVRFTFDDDAIPDHTWNYIVILKRGLDVTTEDGRRFSPRESYTEKRMIVDEFGDIVGVLPAGLPRWSSTREKAEEYRQAHPSSDCLRVMRVLMLPHSDDL